ncbi:hypothetical protein BDW67DRAFT_183386 [Aspergillus spinulosporus]
MRFATVLTGSALSILSTAAPSTIQPRQAVNTVYLGLYSNSGCAGTTGGDVDHVHLTGSSYHNCFAATIKQSVTVSQSLSGYPARSIEEFFAPQTIILIDEAQGSYTDYGFWNTIIKERRSGQGKDIKICLFCSYGSPTTGVEVDRTCFTPATFGPSQRIILTPQPGEESPKVGLFFTLDEFAEAVWLLTTHEYDEKFTIDGEAVSDLSELTNGHPGAMSSLVNFLYSVRTPLYLSPVHRHGLKHRFISAITKDHVLEALKDDDRVFGFLRNQAVFRSFPAEKDLTPEVVETLSNLLEEGNTRYGGVEIPGMQLCYRRGWVHRISVGQFDEDDVVVLPSRLHEKWLEFIIGRKARHLPERFNQLDKLCLAVFRSFSTINLRHAVRGKKMSTAGKCGPMEAQYWDEFYRSFNLVAGRGVPICSEWSRTGGGRFDFYIPEKKWAIKLLRDHDRVDEHTSRFKEGGKYHSWLKENMVDDWIIIDCACSQSQIESSEPRLWTTVFANDYSELKVYDYQKRPLLDIICRIKIVNSLSATRLSSLVILREADTGESGKEQVAIDGYVYSN